MNDYIMRHLGEIDDRLDSLQSDLEEIKKMLRMEVSSKREEADAENREERAHNTRGRAAAKKRKRKHFA